MSEPVFQTPGLVDYLDAWELQRRVHQGVVDGGPDTVLLLEHPPVFTAGKRTEPHERPGPGAGRGAPVLDVDRGGKITFHGPGQLVGYPIVRLPDHVKVVDYVRRLEEALIATCADFGVHSARVPGRSGVWLQGDDQATSRRQRGGAADALDPSHQRKIAAIGIRVSRGVAMHGFALNCDVDLGWYDEFVPCGIDDAGVTSLSAECGRDVPVAEAMPAVRRHLTRLLAWEPYDPTPDYEARPEPGRRSVAVPDLRVPVVNPSS